MGRNILLVNPKNPVGFAERSHILPLYAKKVRYEPLALQIIASLIPEGYEVRFLDINIQEDYDHELQWADLVFLTGYTISEESICEVVYRSHQYGKFVVLGGAHASQMYESIKDVDCIVVGEAEEIMAQWFQDYEAGTLQKIYFCGDKPDLSKAPVPKFDIVDHAYYERAVLQFSRGCPFDCDFCVVPHYWGKQRGRGIPQFIDHLDALYASGFRGTVDITDENFSTNKRLKDLLLAIIDWQERHSYPFAFYCLFSLDFVKREDLMNLCWKAGVREVFIGVETPVQETLKAYSKRPVLNVNIDLVEALKIVSRRGFCVSAGSIVGADTDTEDVFDLQYDFFQEAGTPEIYAMILEGRKFSGLQKKMEAEGRYMGGITITPMIDSSKGFHLDIQHRMDRNVLIRGFLELNRKLYDPPSYFKRCLNFLNHTTDDLKNGDEVGPDILARFTALIVPSVYAEHFFRFLSEVQLQHPNKFWIAVDLGIKGFHYHTVAETASKFNVEPSVPSPSAAKQLPRRILLPMVT